jgi:hypothetical protein
MPLTPEEITAIAAEVVRLQSEQRSQPPLDDLDWGLIELPTVTAGQRRPECGKLGESTLLMLIVLAAVEYDGSMAQLLKTSAQMYLKAKWLCGLKKLKPIAAREGIAVEEVINRIASGTLKL